MSGFSDYIAATQRIERETFVREFVLNRASAGEQHWETHSGIDPEQVRSWAAQAYVAWDYIKEEETRRAAQGSTA